MVDVELARGTHLEPDVLVLERLAAARLAAVVVLYHGLLGLAHHLIIIIHGRRAPRLVEPALDAVVRDGVRVVIDSIVDGELISTNYAHMQYGSLRVQPGQVIKLGDVVGAVGTTGRSTGPHLHFEVLLNGKTPTEPMAWLAAHNVASTVVTVPDAPAVVNQ